MFGMAGGQDGVDLGMADAAIFRGGLGGVVNFQGHVGRMAGQAIADLHGLEMRGMAAKAFGDKAMTRMAGGAGEGGVDAWVLAQLRDLPGMTGGAGSGGLVIEGDV